MKWWKSLEHAALALLGPRVDLLVDWVDERIFLALSETTEPGKMKIHEMLGRE